MREGERGLGGASIFQDLDLGEAIARDSLCEADRGRGEDASEARSLVNRAPER